MNKSIDKMAISVLIKRYYKVNKKRNILIIIAVLLITFVITAICSLGMGYWDAIDERSVMMEGIKYDVRLPTPTQRQVVTAQEMKEILYAGVSVKCAIISTFESKETEIRLYWSDDISWKNQCIPAFEFMEGNYPESENEVILSTSTLGKMEIENPEIGMEIDVTYSDLSDKGAEHDKTLRLSGYFRDYTNELKGFVSESFYKTTGAKQTDLTKGYLNISLKNPIYTEKDIKEISDKLQMEDSQMIYYVPDLADDFMKFVIGITGLFFLILVSGYLFIYNILYISISKDIRFFGLLKLSGMTTKQTKMFVLRQVLINSFIGIPIGLLLGSLVSVYLVPGILQMVNPTLGVDGALPLNPVVYIGSALFSLITIFFSTRKPVILAGNISPIEASKYISVKTSRREKKREWGSTSLGMAWRNIFRDKKQAMIIFLSFFIALTSFLTITVLVSGNSAKKILNASYRYDMRIMNQLTIGVPTTQILEPSSIQEVEALDGVSSIRKIISARVVIPYEENYMGNYFKGIFKEQMLAYSIGGTYDEHLKKFKTDPESEVYSGRLVGIDESGFEYINQKMNGQINKEDFMSGKIGIIRGFFGVPIEEAVGKTLDFSIPDNSSTINFKIKIAGECKEQGGLNYFSPGIGPHILISEELATNILEHPIYELADISYVHPFDTSLDNKIKDMFQNKNSITFESKLDDFEEMKSSETQLKILGGGLGGILALLAILNYVTMISAGIQSRTREFASLQSVGMTTEQIRKVLMLEGLGYAVISTIISLLLGIPISYLIYSVMQKHEVQYAIPIGVNIFVYLTIFVICIILPIIVYHFRERKSIVEQLRDID